MNKKPDFKTATATTKSFKWTNSPSAEERSILLILNRTLSARLFSIYRRAPTESWPRKKGAVAKTSYPMATRCVSYRMQPCKFPPRTTATKMAIATLGATSTIISFRTKRTKSPTTRAWIAFLANRPIQFERTHKNKSLTCECPSSNQ